MGHGRPRGGPSAASLLPSWVRDWGPHGHDVPGLHDNAITLLPSAIGALTKLAILDLSNNRLTGVPTEFHTVNLPTGCGLSDNPGCSCANVGAGTSCCTGDVQFGNKCGEGLSGGPCYVG